MDQPLETVPEASESRTERAPRTHVGNVKLPTDSMVTVSLSDRDQTSVRNTLVSNTSDAAEERGTRNEVDSSIDSRQNSATSIPTLVTNAENESEPYSASSRKNSIHREVQVDWASLDQKESEEMRDERSDEATALLLARLEQENNRLATDPKSALKTRQRSESRPPSLQQLRKMLEQDPTAVRYSILPSPPPMTQLEFWAALTSNYLETALRLPILTSNKIRAGLPDPLRGQIWLSIAGARDPSLEERYNHLCRESSPHEPQIGKDVGRSFPNHDYFRNPQSAGQRALSNVLKCFSIYDPEIGYCQGLGFPVGTLLKNMGEREAFCVLVRLMNDYNLRSCFLPELPGLHLRVYQFQQLLRQHLPTLAAHFDEISITGADYLTQWCLSLFAAHCPDSMLFRIYDIMFAEGASETIMRVALSIMRRNEERLLNSDYEEAMAILLGPQVWEPYGPEPEAGNELVNDFTSYTGIVTRDSLSRLEASFKEAQKDGSAKGDVSPGVQSAAARFFGRLWVSAAKPTSLSPGLPSGNSNRRSSSFMLLRRTTSKQSLTSTINSAGLPSEGTHSFISEAPTQATSISRQSSGDELSMKSPTASVSVPGQGGAHSKDREMHKEIEELLVALSERQRENALLASQLQKIQEDRAEDQRITQTLMERLKQPRTPPASDNGQNRRRTTVSAGLLSVTTPSSLSAEFPHDVQTLLNSLAGRFSDDPRLSRKSSTFETKSSLREALTRTRDQLHVKSTMCEALSQELNEEKVQTHLAQDALKETRQRLQESYSKNNQLEKSIQDLRRGNDRRPSSVFMGDVTPPLSRSETSESIQGGSGNALGGLREFKLGRSGSVKQTSKGISNLPKRGSSLITATENVKTMDQDALLIELVSAKTAEASAKQELEELRAKFDSLKKVIGGVSIPATPKTETPPNITPANAGGFWGWGRRTASTTTITAADTR